MKEVLEIFTENDYTDDWARIFFFLGPRRSLGGKRPLDLLRRGEIERVKELAWSDGG